MKTKYTLPEVSAQLDYLQESLNCSRQDAFFYLRRWYPDMFEALDELFRADPASRRKRSSKAA